MINNFSTKIISEVDSYISAHFTTLVCIWDECKSIPSLDSDLTWNPSLLSPRWGLRSNPNPSNFFSIFWDLEVEGEVFVSYFELGLLDFVCFPFESNEILIGQFILKVKALLWTAGDLLDTIDWFRLMFISHLLESCLHQILSLGEHYRWAILLFNAYACSAFRMKLYLSWAWPKPSQPIVFSIVLDCC